MMSKFHSYYSLGCNNMISTFGFSTFTLPLIKGRVPCLDTHSSPPTHESTMTRPGSSISASIQAMAKSVQSKARSNSLHRAHRKGVSGKSWHHDRFISPHREMNHKLHIVP